MEEGHFHVVEDEGRQYLFEGPRDMTSAILLAQRGRLLAFRLNKNHGFSTLTGVKVNWQRVSALNRIPVNVDPDTWREALAKQLAAYRDDGFRGEIRATVDLKQSVVRRDSKGFYVERTRPCSKCGVQIFGRLYLGVKGQVITTFRSFEPNDEKVLKVGHARQVLCAKCVEERPAVAPPPARLEDLLRSLEETHGKERTEFAHGVTYTLMRVYQVLFRGGA